MHLRVHIHTLKFSVSEILCIVMQFAFLTFNVFWKLSRSVYIEPPHSFELLYRWTPVYLRDGVKCSVLLPRLAGAQWTNISCWITSWAKCSRHWRTLWYFSFHQLCKSLSPFGLSASESGLEIYPRLFLAYLARGSAALWNVNSELGSICTCCL